MLKAKKNLENAHFFIIFAVGSYRRQEGGVLESSKGSSITNKKKCATFTSHTLYEKKTHLNLNNL